MRPITDRLSSVIKFLVVANALVFTYYYVVPASQYFIRLHLAAGSGIWRLEVWQPLTSLFVHIRVIPFLLNLLGLWWVGAPMETQLGTRRFLTVFFATGLAGNLIEVVLGGPGGPQPATEGCGTPLLALFIAFGTIMDRTPARIFGSLVMEARTFMLILIGYVLLVDLSARAWPALAGHVVAMIMGHVMAGGRGRGVRTFWHSLRAKRVRRRYQVLEGGRRGAKPQDLN